MRWEWSRITGLAMMFLGTAVLVLVGCDQQSHQESDEPAAAVSPAYDQQPEAQQLDESEEVDQPDEADEVDTPEDQPDEEDSRAPSYYTNACDEVTGVDEGDGETAEEFATRIACTIAEQYRMTGEEEHEEPDPGIEVTVRAVEEDDTIEFSHRFASAEHLRNCVEFGYGESLDEPEPLSSEHCDAPDEMAPLLLAHRASMVPEVKECDDHCCSFEEHPPVHRGLRAREVCFETEEHNEETSRQLTEVTLERTGDNPDLRAERQRQATLEFGWHWRQREFEKLEPLFSTDSSIDIDVTITSNVEDDTFHELSFEEPEEFMGQFGAEDYSMAPDDPMTALAGPFYFAYLGVTSCKEDCCELAGGGARHRHLFVEEVCFEHDHRGEPAVNRFELRWQW